MPKVELEWRDIDGDWFATYDHVDDRCIYVKIEDGIIAVSEGSLEVSIDADASLPKSKRLAECMVGEFIRMANAITRSVRTSKGRRL